MDERLLEKIEENIYAANQARAAEIARQTLRSRNLNGRIFSDCQECEEPLPEARAKAGYFLCVQCKSDQEKAQKNYAKH